MLQSGKKAPLALRLFFFCMSECVCACVCLIMGGSMTPDESDESLHCCIQTKKSILVLYGSPKNQSQGAKSVSKTQAHAQPGTWHCAVILSSDSQAPH